MANSTNKKLDALTSAIERLIENKVVGATGATGAAGAVGAAGVSASPADHDLIVKVDTKVDQIQADVTELKQAKNNYVTQPEHLEVLRLTADLDKRTKDLELCSIPKEDQKIMENKVTKSDKITSNIWIYLTLYGVALGSLYVLMVVHILQTK
jgi:hypothetical protein